MSRSSAVSMPTSNQDLGLFARCPALCSTLRNGVGEERRGPETSCQSARCFDPRWPPESQHGSTAGPSQRLDPHARCQRRLPEIFTPFVFMQHLPAFFFCCCHSERMLFRPSVAQALHPAAACVCVCVEDEKNRPNQVSV